MDSFGGLAILNRCGKMIQFQVYLRSELGKLSNRSEADWFLRSVSHHVLEVCGLAKVATELTEAFRSQDKVDAFVANLTADQLMSLTKACDQDWRKNHVFDELNKARDWQRADIPIESIDVQQAETTLALLFERNNFQLSRLVADPELGQHDPYKSSAVGKLVEFPICLALRINDRYQLFDGIHRGIQMARNGKKMIQVVYAAE